MLYVLFISFSFYFCCVFRLAVGWFMLLCSALFSFCSLDSPRACLKWIQINCRYGMTFDLVNQPVRCLWDVITWQSTVSHSDFIWISPNSLGHGLTNYMACGIHMNTCTSATTIHLIIQFSWTTFAIRMYTRSLDKLE